jgi:hypothetical protein
LIQFQRASMCVSGRDSARPGIGSNRARVPVLAITFAPRSRRAVPFGKRNFQSSRANEAAGSENEFSAALFVLLAVELDQI